MTDKNSGRGGVLAYEMPVVRREPDGHVAERTFDRTDTGRNRHKDET